VGTNLKLELRVIKPVIGEEKKERKRGRSFACIWKIGVSSQILRISRPSKELPHVKIIAKQSRVI
jgi:hypothetical protein